MDKLKILLAKGRIYESVYSLLSDVGISIHLPDRTYFPTTNQKDLSFQVVKPQITSLLLANNKADIGFSGKDWVYENGVQDKVVEIMDLGFDPVRIVAAIPETKDYDQLLKGPVTIATEYQALSAKYVADKKINGTIFRTWGPSEGFVQDNNDSIAQILIDNTSTGSSLRANRLKIVDTLMESSTRLYASKAAMEDPAKKEKILELKMLFETVLNARSRVMLEMNCPEDAFDNLIKGMPAMKSPIVSPLFGGNGYAIKIAVTVISAQKLAVQIEADARKRANAMLADADRQVKARVGSIEEETIKQEKRLAEAKAATSKFIDSMRAMCNAQLKNLDAISSGIFPQGEAPKAEAPEAKPVIAGAVRGIEDSVDDDVQIEFPPVKKAAPVKEANDFSNTQPFSF